jgi:glycosyltransferase involved in cell wall biosynthesis
MLHALQEEFDLTLVTRGGWDPEALGRLSGLNLRPVAMRPAPFPRLLARQKAGAVWHGLFCRWCRQIAPDYDLAITLSGCLDWGVAAIHRISDVLWHPELRTRFAEPQPASAARRALQAVGRGVAGRSGRRATHQDLFLANSRWTAQVSAPLCTRRPMVLYPQVAPVARPAEWGSRTADFICLGRIAPEKRLETVVEVLLRVRTYFPVRLHLAGACDTPDYGRAIRELCRRHGEWIVGHGLLEADAKRRLLDSCRFGLSACLRESFGLATAEMMAAGVVPFVPRQGAQAELVEDASLIYRDRDEAVDRILAVLSSPRLQTRLHHAVLRRAETYHPPGFARRVRELVRAELRHRRRHVSAR